MNCAGSRSAPAPRPQHRHPRRNRAPDSPRQGTWPYRPGSPRRPRQSSCRQSRAQCRSGSSPAKQDNGRRPDRTSGPRPYIRHSYTSYEGFLSFTRKNNPPRPERQYLKQGIFTGSRCRYRSSAASCDPHPADRGSSPTRSGPKWHPRSPRPDCPPRRTRR